ncbi:MAG: type II/IV secretion system protein [Polyangiaceae bacterium]|nr:type II/IV secretion system protein [Polyangiaceae bacterium]
MQSAAAPRRVTFEQLVAALLASSAIDVAQQKRALARKDATLNQLVRARLAAEKGTVEQHRAAVSPVELFLALGERDQDDKPFREDAVTEVYARALGLPYVKLDPLALDPEFTVSVLSKPFARKHGLLALREDAGVITCATGLPPDALTLETLERTTGKQVALVVSSKSDIERIVTDFYGFRRSVQRAEQMLHVGVDIGNLEQFVRMKSEQEIEASDEHVVHAVDYLFRYALEQRASDIHVEPKRADGIVRFRIDGALHTTNRLPKIVHSAVVNRLKMLARLDIAEKRKPQDGRIKTEYQGRAVDIRVSTLPVAFGEKVVLRIFDPELVDTDLSALGFFERDRRLIEEVLARPHGIFLVTGPTGSGKTTTLYTALRRLATDDVNVTTIEDPIEMVFDGINQTAIAPAIGLGFAEVLRTILRQDPDVVMVGEIRDLDTARHAVQASLTGHLVLSTLHTNDAASAVSRLVDLGVESFLLSSTLAGVMAQRLVRRICSSCARERELSAEEKELLSLDLPVIVRFGEGCVDCRRTGYVGRTCLAELFRVTPEIRRLIHERAPDDRIKAQARAEGMSTLRESAVQKLLQGETTYEEVVAVTAEDA